MDREFDDKRRVTIATFKLKKPILNFPVGYHMDLVFDFRDDRTTSGSYYHLELTAGVLDEYKLPPSIISDREFFELHKCKMNEMLEELGFIDWVTDIRGYNLEVFFMDVDRYLNKDFHKELAKLLKLKFKVTRQVNDIRVSLGKGNMLK